MEHPAHLRIGGLAALIGGVGGIVVNAFHPPPPPQTAELLALVASLPHWALLHDAAALAAVLVVVGLALLVHTLEDSEARALGEAGKYVTVLGAAVFVVAIVIDGHGYPYYAERWMLAGADERASILLAAGVVRTVDLALFPIWTGLFLGMGMLLIAVALWRSAEYPRTVAAVGILGGGLCLVFSLSTLLGRPMTWIWPAGPAVGAVWVTALGVMMLRKISARGSQSSPS
ncbi:MAG: hypothetical protein R3247_05410 [Rhodothermales bacterium]|nr:hypothetical protein [Rhodothermales bacterium]